MQVIGGARYADRNVLTDLSSVEMVSILKIYKFTVTRHREVKLEASGIFLFYFSRYVTYSNAWFLQKSVFPLCLAIPIPLSVSLTVTRMTVCIGDTQEQTPRKVVWFYIRNL